MKQVDCKISKVILQDEETLLINIEAEKKFDLSDFIELKKAALKLGNGRSFYNIINVGEFTLPTKAAREASCSPEGSYYKIADAFVIKTLAQKIMGNLMIRLNRPTVPTKFFKSIAEAEQWLNLLKMESRAARMLV